MFGDPNMEPGHKAVATVISRELPEMLVSATISSAFASESRTISIVEAGGVTSSGSTIWRHSSLSSKENSGNCG